MNGLEKVADPYSKKYRCPAPDGFDCLDLEETYLKDERKNGDGSEVMPAEWAGGVTEMTITDPENKAYAEIIKIYEHPATEGIDVENSIIDADVEKEIIKIVENHSGKSASDQLIDFIRAKNIFPDIEGKVLQNIATTYLSCIKTTQKENKKNLKKAAAGKLKFGAQNAVANLRKCTAYLQNVPGLVDFKSNEISERLRIQRENETRKYIAGLVKAGKPPLRIPAKTIQVRICTYPDDKDILNKDHHLFVTVGEGKWVVDRNDNDGYMGVLKPLER